VFNNHQDAASIQAQLLF